jgi:hypothetical protein
MDGVFGTDKLRLTQEFLQQGKQCSAFCGRQRIEQCRVMLVEVFLHLLQRAPPLGREIDDLKPPIRTRSMTLDEAALFEFHQQADQCRLVRYQSGRQTDLAEAGIALQNEERGNFDRPELQTGHMLIERPENPVVRAPNPKTGEPGHKPIIDSGFYRQTRGRYSILARPTCAGSLWRGKLWGARAPLGAALPSAAFSAF